MERVLAPDGIFVASVHGNLSYGFEMRDLAASFPAVGIVDSISDPTRGPPGGDLANLVRTIPARRLEEIFPGIERSTIQLLARYDSIKTRRFLSDTEYPVASDELMALCAMVSNLKPGRILKIGTFRGGGTANLTLNAPPWTGAITRSSSRAEWNTRLARLRPRVHYEDDQLISNGVYLHRLFYDAAADNAPFSRHRNQLSQ